MSISTQITSKFLAISIVLLLVGCGIGYVFAPGKIVEKPIEKIVEKKVPALSGEIPIGIIYCSAEWALRDDPPALEIFKEELRDYIKKLGLNVTFNFLEECAEGSPVKALEKLESLFAKGCKVVVNLRWSSHVKAIKSYADEHHIVIISSGSTSPLLSIPGDFIFRLVPDDTFQAKVLVKLYEDLGIKAIIVIQRGDPWGDGLYNELNKLCDEKGIVIYDRIRYSPEAKEFSAEVGRLAQKVREAIERYGENAVGIQSLSFYELSTILAQSEDYPELMKVRWFGADGMKSGIEEEVGSIIVRVRYLGPYAAPTISDKYKEFCEKYKAKTGELPTLYTIAFYDVLWITVKAILEAERYDPDVIKEILPTIAASYFGASGLCKLNEAGDKAGADYDIWTVVEKNGAYEWEVIGRYDQVTGQITWFKSP